MTKPTPPTISDLGLLKMFFVQKKTMGEITMTEESTRKMKPWMKSNTTRLYKNS